MYISSYQQLAELHEVKHVALMHLGQLLAQLNGLLPHLRRHVHRSVKKGYKNHKHKNTEAHARLCHLAHEAVLYKIRHLAALGKKTVSL